MKSVISLSIVACSLYLPTWEVRAEDWGTLKGQITLSGKPPAAAKLDITRDAEFCGQHGLVDGSLVVNEKNGGLQNVVVWLYAKSEVPVHPSLAKTPAPAKLDNKNCSFHPRVVRLQTGQILQSTNSDPVAHNVAVYARRNTPFSIVIPEDKPLEKTFRREELLPIRVDCSIHAWMRAYLIITEHPYSAVTDRDGRFTIPNLPAGTWNFKFWHERPGYIPSVTTADGEIELSRGVWEVEVKPGETDLGQLTVQTAAFAEED